MRTLWTRLAWALCAIVIVCAAGCVQQGVTDPVVLQQAG